MGLELATLEREFPMTDGNFATIKTLAYTLTGIRLSDHKRSMVYSRLARRLRLLGCRDFDAYCAIISTDSHPERSEFVNAITTNLTSFFREPHHFQFLREQVCPELMSRHARDKRVRLWSAGCSTGEEAYSIALTVREAMPAAGWDIRLLATDLDSNVVAQAAAGTYPRERVEPLSAEQRKRWLLHDRAGGQIRVKPELAQMITFKRLNLLGNWPLKGPFDVIFCRNVVIYFDKDTQRRLFDRYANILAPGGYLFIGHSENLHGVSSRFRSLGRTMYQKIR